MTNKTPQWEKEYTQIYEPVASDNYELARLTPEFHADIKAFIKSTLEEVIEKIPDLLPSGVNNHFISTEDLKSQLRKEFGL